MPHNLWIGRPGSLREIDQAGKSWDRTADLGVTEFRSLAGRATVVVTPRPVRRLKLSWEALDQGTASYLDRLARRVDGSGPLAVIDAASVNLLEPAMAAGTARPGSATSNYGSPAVGFPWFAITNQPSNSGANAGTIIESPTLPGAFGFSSPAVGSQMGWKHPMWAGIPVMPGMTVSFSLPTAFPVATATAELDFKAADGTVISTPNVTGRMVTAVAPAGAVFVTPVARAGVVGSFSLSGACLTIGSDSPSDALAGDGCPAMSVTGYSDTGSVRLPYRNVSLDLVEVGSAVG